MIREKFCISTWEGGTVTFDSCWFTINTQIAVCSELFRAGSQVDIQILHAQKPTHDDAYDCCALPFGHLNGPIAPAIAKRVIIRIIQLFLEY